MFSCLKKNAIGFALLITGSLAFAATPPPAPDIDARAYVLLDATTGTIIASKNEHQEFPPASLTKMMTSYVVEHEIQNGSISLDDNVPVSVKAWKMEGSRTFIREGTEVKLDDLLRGSIIQSGNDASVAMAEYVAGSEDAFADLMNQHAKKIGMQNSHFMNATGLPADNHYSSAYDIAILGAALVNTFPEHYSIYGEKSFTYNNIKQNNRNKLLFTDSTVDGIKTGWTQESGYCMAASSERNGVRLIAVVMGAESPTLRAQFSQELLNYGFRYFNRYTLFNRGEVMAEAPIFGGAKDDIMLGVPRDIIMTLPKDQLPEAFMEVRADLEAPISIGETVGLLMLKSADGTVISKTDLVALESVEEGSFFKKLFDHIKRWWASLFG